MAQLLILLSHVSPLIRIIAPPGALLLVSQKGKIMYIYNGLPEQSDSSLILFWNSPDVPLKCKPHASLELLRNI